MIYLKLLIINSGATACKNIEKADWYSGKLIDNQVTNFGMINKNKNY